VKGKVYGEVLLLLYSIWKIDVEKWKGVINLLEIKKSLCIRDFSLFFN